MNVDADAAGAAITRDHSRSEQYDVDEDDEDDEDDYPYDVHDNDVEEELAALSAECESSATVMAGDIVNIRDEVEITSDPNKILDDSACTSSSSWTMPVVSQLEPLASTSAAVSFCEQMERQFRTQAFSLPTPSLVDLTAQQDLENNNDPNNNASDLETMPTAEADDHYLDDLNDVIESQKTQQHPTEETEDKSEGIRLALEKDTRLILKLMPHKTFDEVHNYLEAHINNPARVQVILNEFLEQAEQTRSDADDDFPVMARVLSPEPVKNKSGNGLKSKNSKKKTAKAEAVQESDPPTSVSNIAGDVPDVRPPIKLRLKIPPASVRSPSEKRKSSDLPGEKVKRSRANSLDDFDPQEGSSKSVLGALPPQSVKSSRGTAKFELTEEQIHGPFNFSDHRKKPSGRLSKKPSFEGMRPDLMDLAHSTDANGFAGASGFSGAALAEAVKPNTPPLVDLSQESSPPVVDISHADGKEKMELLASLLEMFPDTPQLYLAEQADELAGKEAAINRFIEEQLARGPHPPDYWVPNKKLLISQDNEVEEQLQAPVVVEDRLLEVEAPVPEVVDIEPAEHPAPDNVAENEEDKINITLTTLQNLFPQTDPEFLHQKVLEFAGDEGALNQWINEGLEHKGSEFPSRAEYDKRQEEAQLQEKYSRKVTVQDILEMYDDPEQYFGNTQRNVSELYKKHSLCQLKREFRNLSAAVINKVFNQHNGLYYPSFKSLQNHGGGQKRKTKRPDHECSMPQEIDINFLKELQFSRIEQVVKEYKENKAAEKVVRMEAARKNNDLMSCNCCFNDECLPEDMLPCKSGHLFCTECVQRASEVAIGEGKAGLSCLGECQQPFELSTLQRALNANVFSKWLRKIQLAEVEQAAVEGLARCPFCEFATIMDTSPEENKIFMCQNPDCGKESCRLCNEISHIPLRCEEVEKDAEVRKRTYIENKMTEALIRKCWKCSKPFLKLDGCNKMTCECGAQMCYLCRQPVRDYAHFYGQGAQPSNDKKCPLWSDNKKLHESDVAKGALEAKNEMERENPFIKLKHDPTKDINLAETANNQKPFPDTVGLEGIIGHDPVERQRFIRHQQVIEDMIRRNQHPFVDALGRMNPGPPPVFPGMGLPPAHGLPPVPPMFDGPDGGLVHRMGELLQLREAQRLRQRQIRRREMEALADFQAMRQPMAGGANLLAPEAAPAHNVLPPPVAHAREIHRHLNPHPFPALGNNRTGDLAGPAHPAHFMLPVLEVGGAGPPPMAHQGHRFGMAPMPMPMLPPAPHGMDLRNVPLPPQMQLQPQLQPQVGANHQPPNADNPLPVWQDNVDWMMD